MIQRLSLVHVGLLRTLSPHLSWLVKYSIWDCSNYNSDFLSFDPITLQLLQTSTFNFLSWYLGVIMTLRHSLGKYMSYLLYWTSVAIFLGPLPMISFYFRSINIWSWKALVYLTPYSLSSASSQDGMLWPWSNPMVTQLVVWSPLRQILSFHFSELVLPINTPKLFIFT